jgi:outer membrane protein
MPRLFILILLFSFTALPQKSIIYLSWDKVIESSVNNNLSVKAKNLEFETQNLEVWRSWSNFLPSLRYQGLAIRNFELPVLVFMNQQFSIGNNYTLQHTFDLSLPIFTGGLRYFNVKAQNALKKSLSEELKGTENDAILQSLEAYYAVLLADSLAISAREAVNVAKSNLNQVTLFYNEGSATELDMQRARAQYYTTLPQLESANSGRILSRQRLKFLLNIPLSDSLVVTDSLVPTDFLKQFNQLNLNELKILAEEGNHFLSAVRFRVDAAKEGEKIALSQFAPTLAVAFSLQYQAFNDEGKFHWNDYYRSKSLALSLTWPLFDGGRTVLDYQAAQIRTDQINIMKSVTSTQTQLEVEQNFYSLSEAANTLKSLEEALNQTRESLRLSNLLYAEGMSTQLEVLNTQLLYNNSRLQYLQGIFNYNIRQLSLLKSIGLLKSIWKQQ